jgi:hypothetical protein
LTKGVNELTFLSALRSPKGFALRLVHVGVRIAYVITGIITI